MSPSDTEYTLRLSESEVRTLDWLASRLGTPPEEALRDLFLRGLQVAAGVEREGADQELSTEELFKRVLRGYLASLPEEVEITPESLRLIARAYERVADTLPRERELRRRQEAGRKMTELRERVRERGGSLSDASELISTNPASTT